MRLLDAWQLHVALRQLVLGKQPEHTGEGLPVGVPLIGNGFDSHCADPKHAHHVPLNKHLQVEEVYELFRQVRQQLENTEH